MISHGGSRFSRRSRRLRRAAGAIGTPTPSPAPSDTTPNAFSFAPVVGAQRSALVASNQVVPTGFDANAPISIEAGGEYQIGEGAWTSATGTFAPGSAVRVRLTSSSSYATLATIDLNIGGTIATFSVTTRADPSSIPILEPGNTFDRTEDLSSVPTASETPYGTVDPTWQPGVQFRAYDYQVIDELTYITVIPATGAEGGIAAVYAGCEGNEVECPWGQNPDDGSWGYIFGARSPSSGTVRNGPAKVWVRAVPVNGVERVFAKTLVFNTATEAADHIATKTLYVDPDRPDNNGNGLSWATAKQTVFDAELALTANERNGTPGTGATAAVICRFELAPNKTHKWHREIGRTSGVNRTFRYRPIINGGGKRGTAGETVLTWEGYTATPSSPTLSFIDTWHPSGPCPVIQNVRANLDKLLYLQRGYVWIDCTREHILSVQAQQANTDKGYPIGYRSTDIPDAASSFNNWNGFFRNTVGQSTPLLNGFGRFGEPRHVAIRCTDNLMTTGGQQERWDGEEIGGYDFVSILSTNDYLLDNQLQVQYGNIEYRRHVAIDLIVATADYDSRPGKTRLTFSNGPFEFVMNDPVQYLRVLESANNIPVGNTPYSPNINGEQPFDTMGWFCDANTGTTDVANQILQVAAVIQNAQGGRLQPGDKVRLYGIAHVDSMQVIPDGGSGSSPTAPRPPRENFILRNRKVWMSACQRFLNQNGRVPASQTGAFGAAVINPEPISGITISSNGTTVTFDPAVPVSIYKHVWLIPISGSHPGGTYDARRHARRVMRIVNSTTVEIDEAFPTDLPAGTTFGIHFSMVSFYEINGISHQYGFDNLISNQSIGMASSAFINMTHSGADPANNRCWVVSQTNGKPYVRGGHQVRFINSIITRVTAGTDNVLPSDIEFIDCHIERAEVMSGAVYEDVTHGYVYGGADSAAQADLADFYNRNGWPNQAVVGTISTPWPGATRDIFGNQFVAGSPRGALAQPPPAGWLD